ncbi:hypothetical protein CBR_g8242 [Chara braunii]|uniref:Uncharacterized protein n=1 Tax=Chara braunii TaxID=69332 RepID=A0A388KLL6_CHABU|nr:hypothetical protein CBR_g8242 [Chara braunii]|eukprot:GBG70941.1 hypothetical protein CBR_g8242 [Chara braunii]
MQEGRCGSEFGFMLQRTGLPPSLVPLFGSDSYLVYRRDVVAVSLADHLSSSSVAGLGIRRGRPRLKVVRPPFFLRAGSSDEAEGSVIVVLPALRARGLGLVGSDCAPGDDDTRTGTSTSPCTAEQDAKATAIPKERREKEVKKKALVEEQSAKLKKIEEEMVREKERIKKEEGEKLKAVEEEEEVEEQPLERRRTGGRGESSGTKEDQMEKKITEWVAGLSLGEEEEALMDFARELAMQVGSEVKARLEGTKCYYTGVIEGARLTAPKEEEARPRREPVKVKFPDSYRGKKEENFDNWEANVKTYVHYAEGVPGRTCPYSRPYPPRRSSKLRSFLVPRRQL